MDARGRVCVGGEEGPWGGCLLKAWVGVLEGMVEGEHVVWSRGKGSLGRVTLPCRYLHHNLCHLVLFSE